MRMNGRKANELRPVAITNEYLKHGEGSVHIAMGDTRVICTASVEERVPPFLRATGNGWVTAEYAMLPRSTSTRSARESTLGRPGGRTQEIQRLIGRSLRSVVDLTAFGERTVTLDCDVIQADGGTRTAAITGAYVAMVEAFRHLVAQGIVDRVPVRDLVAAISVGVVDGRVFLDLDYQEDSQAWVDMNLVATGSGKFVEIQGCAEREPFSRELMDRILAAGLKGIRKLAAEQKRVLGPIRFAR